MRGNGLVRRGLFAVLVAALLASGCGGGGSSGENSENAPQGTDLFEQAPLTPQVRDDASYVVIPDDGSVTTTRTPEEGEFVLTGSLPAIRPGQIVVARKVLGKVESVRQHRGEVVVHTSPASLNDIVQTGTVDVQHQLTADDIELDPALAGARVRSVGGSRAIELTNISVYDTGFASRYGGTDYGGNVQVKILTGLVDFRPNVRFRADLDLLQGVNAAFVIGGSVRLRLRVQSTVRLNGTYRFQIPIGRIDVPFIGAVGPIPVYGRIHGNVVAGFELEAAATGTMVQELDTVGDLELGARFENSSWRPVATRSIVATPAAAGYDLRGDVDLRAYLRPELAVTLYELTGTTLSFEPALLFKTAVGSNGYDWELRWALTSRLMLRAAVFDRTLAEYSATLISLGPELLASGSGALPGGGGTPDPVPQPVLSVLPSADLQIASTETSQQLSIYNEGDGDLSWTVSDDAPWLTATPAAGTNTRYVTLTVDRSGLSAGTHTATVTISSNGGSQTRRVRVNVSQLDVVVQ